MLACCCQHYNCLQNVVVWETANTVFRDFVPLSARHITEYLMPSAPFPIAVNVTITINNVPAQTHSLVFMVAVCKSLCN